MKLSKMIFALGLLSVLGYSSAFAVTVAVPAVKAISVAPAILVAAPSVSKPVPTPTITAKPVPNSTPVVVSKPVTTAAPTPAPSSNLGTLLVNPARAY